MSESEYLNKLSEAIIGAAIAVHRELGPGLLESGYESCLEFELLDRGFQAKRQLELPAMCRGRKIDAGYRIDLLVNDKVLVELRAVEALHSIHEAQTITYLKLSGCKLGLLINFNVQLLTKGLKRLVNRFPS